MLSRFTLKFWPLILLATVAAGALSVPRTIALFKQISTDPLDLLDANHPNVKPMQEIRKKLETSLRFKIVFESERPDKTLAYMEDLALRLAKEPYVRSTTTTKTGFDFFDRHKLFFIDLPDLRTIRDRLGRRIQKEKLRGLLIDFEEEEELRFADIESKYRSRYTDSERNRYWVSPDGKIYALSVEAATADLGLKETSRFYDQVAEFLSRERPAAFEPTLKIYLAGPSRALEYRALVRDLKIAGLVSGLCIFLPLLVRFRNPLVVLLIFSPLALGIPLSFAVGSFFVHKLNVITSFLFAILGGLGIETGIHIYSRYHAARRARRSLEATLDEIYGSFGLAILTSVASVAVTFLLLIVNKFRGFAEFGLIAGLGLWSIFFLYFSFFPSLLIALEKIRLLRFSPQSERAERRLPFSPRQVRAGLWTMGLFTLYSLAAPFLIGFEYDSRKIRADIPEVRVAKEKQRLTQVRVNSPAVVIVHSREEAAALKEAFRKKMEEDKLTPTIDGTRSYYDLVPEDQKQKLKVLSEIRKLLSDPVLRLLKGEKREDVERFKKMIDDTRPFTEKEVPEEAKKIFIGDPSVPGTLFFVYAQPELELDDGRNAIRFVEDVSRIETPRGVYYPSSDANVFGFVLLTMFQDLPTVLLVSLASIALFVYLDFRSVKKTLLILAAILTGVFWLLGIMALFQVKFNFYNIIIIPAVMGMSIDNAIHLLHRYEELGRGSLFRVMASTGLSCLLASLTNAGGFVGLLWSVHRGLFSIGLLSVLGVITCLASTLILLPALLGLLERVRYDRKPVAL